MHLRKSKSVGYRPGFTLVELLVVVGIIGVLAAFALPMLARAMRNSARVRAAMDMQTISGALAAYKQDFTDYPRPDKAKIGFIVLGRALLGPDPENAGTTMATTAGQPGAISGNFIQIKPTAGASAPAENNDWTAIPVRADGADGFGFRIRAGSGRVYGPYIDPNKFSNKNGVLLDPDGLPYLYFAASQKPGKVDGSTAILFAGRGANARWNLDQNNAVESSGALMATNKFQALLGDININGYLDTDESARIDGPFLLWGAGPDNKCGPSGTDKASLADCDDVFGGAGQ